VSLTNEMLMLVAPQDSRQMGETSLGAEASLMVVIRLQTEAPLYYFYGLCLNMRHNRLIDVENSGATVCIRRIDEGAPSANDTDSRTSHFQN